MRFHPKNLSRKQLITIIIALIAISAFGGGIILGEHIQKKSSADIVKGENNEVNSFDLAPFWKVTEILNKKFVSTTASSSIPSNQDKVWGAIEGLTASYGDPYTSFFSPKKAQKFEDEVRGDFGGIGVEIGIKENALTVIAPLKGTPGEKAGLKAGDFILKIDDKFTAGMSTEDAVSLIRGPKGTSVTLAIKQNGTVKDISIMRDTIIIPTIDTKMRNDGVFVISLYNFSANSPQLFREALREFILSGNDKLVLDLRNNPGGYLEAAIDMASWFLPQDKIIVIEDMGKDTLKKAHKSKGYNIFNENLKMAVLINGGSASASEILAGALSEHHIAKLIGEKSFGKGSVQELVDITPDTSLKVTIARWLTPNGYSISQNGINPDVVVKETKKDIEKKYDTQMEKAVEILKR
ncbi:MAG: S41 family peptidase [Candidatus Yonathbacteria bacterium]|nr:S41 family peptidase [Candidatus Yonathbacteria bacterium]